MVGQPTPPVREVFEAIYDHLRSLAGAMGQDRAMVTIQPTELVHEVFLRMSKARSLEWKDEAHFRAIAARAMRQVLIDRARARLAVRRGGGLERVTLSGLDDPASLGDVDLLDLDKALTELEQMDPRRAHLVVLRIFGGLVERELAQELGLSERSVRREWRVARAWLAMRLSA